MKSASVEVLLFVDLFFLEVSVDLHVHVLSIPYTLCILTVYPHTKNDRAYTCSFLFTHVHSLLVVQVHLHTIVPLYVASFRLQLQGSDSKRYSTETGRVQHDFRTRLNSTGSP